MSDILIRGMKMPISPVLLCVHPDGKVFADLEGGWREYKAVPVPPHGRLKDYDQVMKQYSEWFRNCESREYEAMFYMLQNELNAAQTIIQASK